MADQQDSSKRPIVTEVSNLYQRQHAFDDGTRQGVHSGNPEGKKKGHNSSVIIAAWWFEVLSLLGAIGALVAIAATLKSFDKKEQPAWKYSINLNTIISILSVFLRICIVVVVEQVLSQMKWLEYRHPRPLQDLVEFDAAARGPWGSLLLMFRIKRLSSAVFACIVVLLSLGIGPFTQQAVKNVSCDLPLDSSNPNTNIASVQIARMMYGSDLPRVAAGSFDLDMATKAAILESLADPTSNRSAIEPNCPTGNCTFPSYGGITHSSVGFCQKCADISPWISELRETSSPTITGEVIAGDYNFTQFNLVLPNNISVGGGIVSDLDTYYVGRGIGSITNAPRIFFNTSVDDLSWLIASSTTALEDAFLDVLQSSALNFTIISLTQDGCSYIAVDSSQYNVSCVHSQGGLSPYWESVNSLAATCALYPCIKNYHGIVDDTTFVETLVNETPLIIPENQDISSIPEYRQFDSPCEVDGQVYTLANITSAPSDHALNTTLIDGKNVSVPHKCFFGTSGVYIRALQEFIQDTVKGGCDMPGTSYFAETSSPNDWNTVTCKAWWLKNLFNKGNVSLDSISANMEAVAVAITNEMRRQGSDWDGNAAYTKGHASRATVCTQFNWEWLIFPLGLIVLTTLALLIMIGKTLLDKQGIPLWKSSALPLLFAGNGIGANQASEHNTQIESEAKAAMVELNHDGTGWTFVGEHRDESSGETSLSINDFPPSGMRQRR